MSQSKAKEIRGMERQAVTVVYEVTTKIYSNGNISVTANKDEALRDPLLFLSIQSDMSKAVIKSWQKLRESIPTKNDGGKIILPH